jgi:hypothetical protein
MTDYETAILATFAVFAAAGILWSLIGTLSILFKFDLMQWMLKKLQAAGDCLNEEEERNGFDRTIGALLRGDETVMSITEKLERIDYTPTYLDLGTAKALEVYRKLVP